MNIFTEIEDYIKDWLKNDSDVNGNYYTTKLIEEEHNFSRSEVPAVSVYCYNINANKGKGTSKINGKVEVFVKNKNPKENNTECKELVSNIYLSLKKKGIPGITSPSDIAIVEIDSLRAEVLPSELFKGLMAYGYVDFEVEKMD